MTLLSAQQDFSERTLASIRGVLKRLLYVAGLRGEDGRYQHWGMVKMHGEAATQSAIGKAHAAALLDVVRTPLQELNTESMSGEGEVLRGSEAKLLPEGASKASALHLNSVLLALDALARRRAQSTRRDA